MNLPEEAVLEFQALLAKKGVEASLEDAELEGKELLTLMALAQGQKIPLTKYY